MCFCSSLSSWVFLSIVEVAQISALHHWYVDRLKRVKDRSLAGSDGRFYAVLKWPSTLQEPSWFMGKGKRFRRKTEKVAGLAR